MLAVTRQFSQKVTARQAELMARGLPSKKRLEGVQHVLLVSSGKGGVGKSTVSVNLAAALAQLPARPRISLLDADIFGPSVPTMLGLEESERPLTDSRGRLEPLVNHGISCMSIGKVLVCVQVLFAKILN